MTPWLKMVGAARQPLSTDWLNGMDVEEGRNRRDLLERVRFPRTKRPSGVEAGDRLVYYAAGAYRYFAIVEVLSSEPYRTDEDPRWPYALDVKPLLLVGHIDDAPPLSDLRLRKGNLSVRHQSHILLTPDQFASAVAGICSVAR